MDCSPTPARVRAHWIGHFKRHTSHNYSMESPKERDPLADLGIDKMKAVLSLSPRQEDVGEPPGKHPGCPLDGVGPSLMEQHTNQVM